MQQLTLKTIRVTASTLVALALVSMPFSAAIPLAFATTAATGAPTTVAAAPVGSTTATLNGIGGDTAASNSSFWVSTSTFSTPAPATTETLPSGVYSTPGLGPVASSTAFSGALSSAVGMPAVTPHTTYYFVAWTEDTTSGIWSPGQVLSFTTTSSPTITSVMPNSGSTAGGTSITITGTGFVSGATVTVGGAAATNVIVASSTAITATTPPGTAGAQNVVVTNTDTGTVTSTGGFTYVTPMGTAPTTVAAAPVGSTTATLNGINGSAGASNSSFWVSTSTFSTASPTVPNGVYSTPGLGAQAASAPYSAQLSSITGILPVTPSTTYYFAAWSEVGGIWSPGAVMHFTTLPATSAAPIVSSVSPNTGSTAGGTAVTITGSGFTGATSVKFGSNATASSTVNSPTSITATSSATSTAGIVDVTVTTPVGTSATSTADHFTYTLGGTVTGVGVLNVDSIHVVKDSATADGTYANGWIYTFDITVPTNETNLSMEFANWTGAGTIPAGGNMQISSPQANNAGAEIPITAANTYSAPLIMTGDRDASKPGLQVQVTVDVAVPIGTPNGSYTTSYGVQSN